MRRHGGHYLSRILAGALSLLILSACAGVKFYSDPGLEKRSAFPLFTAKPYLLVTPGNTGAKGITAAVVFLPDLSRPIYFKARSGLGSAKLEFALKDGMLASWGQALVSGVPESLDSLASLVSAASEALNQRQTGREEPGFLLYEIRMDGKGTVLVPVEIRPGPEKK